MTSPSDTESRLGFDQIRHQLKSHCLSSLGERLVDAIHFSTDAGKIRELTRQNEEFKHLFLRGDAFPSAHYYDPTEWFAKAAIEGTWLESTEFLQIAHSLQTVLSCVAYLRNHQEVCPSLFGLAEKVTITKSVPENIFRIIDDRGVVKDSASADLSNIRKRLRDEQARSRKLIDQLYRHALEQHWVPEGALPTIRGGRLVLPILAEHKRRLKGFIHDESATGQTVFMEPAEVLDANNEIRDLEHDEKREVIRILTRLTGSLRAELPQLNRAFDFLAWMDFTRARARYSIEIDAALPVIENKPALSWMDARHPLLYLGLKGKRGLVPLNIRLSESDPILLVSGPNAGGKSVCLKTVGLLQYMLQCGLLVPASPDSTFGIFDNIFIDIGDQQSIENDLSTYSSHLKNMAFFINESTDRTLVLMDELGSGTDPNFGGAIAQAVLQSLLRKKVWAVATTHYYNLKLFASGQPGIRNGAMRFDEHNLVPLYILDIGKPGSSFALEIAEKTGLPEHTLEEAKQLVGIELVGLDKLVRDLEVERNVLTAKLAELEAQKEQVSALAAHYELVTHDLEAKKKIILERAKEDARKLLSDTNKEIEKTIRHIRENQAHKQETQKARKKLRELTSALSTKEVERKGGEAAPIKSGDRVRLIGQEGSGVVMSVKGKWAMVRFGEIISRVALDKLEKTTSRQEFTPTPKRVTSISFPEKRAGYTSTLDVRGKRAEEVASLLEQFIDTSVLLGQGEVKVLHGKGEGVLRKVIREHLARYKHVVSVADEHVERGGDGITVVVLK